MKKQTITPLPFNFYFLPVVFLALAGLLDSLYLSISHFRVYTDIAYKSFCAISRAINCDTVSQSSYSILLDLPIPIWGILGYTFFVLLLPIAHSNDVGKKRVWHLLFFISLCFSIYSVILSFISAYIINSYCIMCIVSYVVNLLLLFYTWIICRRFSDESFFQGFKNDILFLLSKQKMFYSGFILFLFCLSGIYNFLPHYWQFQPPPLSSKIPTGMTKDGHPWVGAEKPELIIEEFTDYQCFQCLKMHFFLRDLIAANPDKIRLVHKNFPMDSEFNQIIVTQPFHEGSGKLAMMAVYAGLKGKFWEMNDILFEMTQKNKVIDIRVIAEKAGIDAQKLAGAVRNKKVKKIVTLDVWQGMKLEITGTPSYLIDGKVYQGIIPHAILQKALNK